MLTLIRQELYKIFKRPLSAYFWVVLVLFQTGVAVYALYNSDALSPLAAFRSGYYTSIPITFFMIALCSTTVSGELQFGTLKAMLYRKYSFYQVLISKWFAQLIYLIFLTLVSVISSLTLQQLIFRNDFSLTATDGGGKLLWQTWLLTSAGGFLSLLFLLAFVLVLATLFRSSTAAIITGISTFFIAGIFNQLLFTIIDQHEWLKWFPLNMMNLGNQIITPSLSKLTHLSMLGITSGYLIYAACFLGLGLFFFRQRNTI